MRSRSIEGVRSLVAQGVGVTILSDLVYRSWSHDAGRIIRRPLSDRIPSMDIGLAFGAQAAGNPAAQLLRLELSLIAKNA